MSYEAVIGLEVHAQLLTESKIFCRCSAKNGSGPNSNTCPVCMGMPGTLPVLNEKAVEFGIRLGLAVGCTVRAQSIFARKNYFYPDLPKGYQITQHPAPLCENGHLDIEAGGSAKRIRIMRIHLEEDAGKTIHDAKEGVSLVDYNRSGVPLLEIVSMPDMSTPEEAASYLRELRLVLMYLGICDGNMEQGSFRCDANVSLRPDGSSAFGTRTEIKNMNSFRNVQKALEYEISRQAGILDKGGAVVQETRLWNAAEGKTASMRSKEEGHDYRYFPEPDLSPLNVDEAWIGYIRRSLPELPASVRKRFREKYGLPPYDADVLTQTRPLAEYFEQCTTMIGEPKEVSNWIMTEVMRVMNEQRITISEFPVSVDMLAGMIDLVLKGTLSGTMAKDVFNEMVSTGRNACEIVKERGAVQISDEEEIREIAVGIVAANPAEAQRYRDGKTGLLGFFVGKLMSATDGRANPKIASRIMKELLEK